MNRKPTTARRLGGSKASVALLVDWLEDEYQNTVMRGALDAARDRALNLVCFCGGVLDSPVRDGVKRNQVFELATRESVSAVIALGGTMGNHSGPSRLAEYCKRYQPLPACCIGIRLEGMPSVLVDNEVGMRAAIVHVIKEHERKRVFFVRGPAVNEEAESRFRVYKNTLQEQGIPFDEQLTYIGDFQPGAGHDAITRALDADIKFDAVVAANDSMAMGALQALKQRGKNVPGDVAVVGFDDVEEARFLDPPLTTVRQPLYEQGKEAVRLLVALMQGDKSATDVTLRTELVVRGSCGCLSAESTLTQHDPGSTLSFEAQMIQRRAVVLADLVRSARATFGGLRAGWEVQLLNALIAELGQSMSGAFLASYSELLQNVYRTGNPLDAWHDVLSTLRRHTLGMLSHDAQRARRAEDVFHSARRAVSNAVERAQASRRIEAERLTRRMARASAALIATFDEQALFAACRNEIPALGVTACYLLRYLPGQGEQAELVFSVGSGDEAEGPERTFPRKRLLPRNFRDHPTSDALIVEPLFFRDYSIGYAVFGIGPKNGTLYESLRDQISAAMYGSSLKANAPSSRGRSPRSKR
jgi:DNA-binding LacI/PurR family transcriptional regulator